MAESVMPRFDPRISERDRHLPLWVEPRTRASAAAAGVSGEGSAPITSAVSLNASATAILELCDRERSIFGIVDTLRQRYIADDVELYVDVTTAVLELRRLGLVAVETAAGPPVKFVIGVEDNTCCRWQLPILFESLIAQLPQHWDIFVVVCNDHRPISIALLHLFDRYAVPCLTGNDIRNNPDIDCDASGGDDDTVIKRREARRVAASHVQGDDLVVLLDADSFLYRELNQSVFFAGGGLERQSFTVEKGRSVPAGTFYRYCGDLKDSGVDGAFYDSEWCQQSHLHHDFLQTDLDASYRAAATPHEQYFFELAKRARRRLSAAQLPSSPAREEPA